MPFFRRWSMLPVVIFLPLAATGTALALNEPGASQANTPAAVSTPAPALPVPAPQGLSAQSGRDKVLLAWSPVTGPGGQKVVYHLFRSSTDLPPAPAPGQSWPLQPINQAPIPDEYYLDDAANSRTPPQPDAWYQYAVIAVDAAGNSSPPSAVLRVLNSGTLCPPMGVEAKSGDAAVTLTWQEPFCVGESGLEGYWIFRSAVAGVQGDPILNAPVTALTYRDVGRSGAPLVNGQAYYYTLVSQDKNGVQSPASEQVSAVPYLPATPPQNFQATAKTDESIELRWDPSAPGTFPLAGYAVYRAVSGTALEGPLNREKLAGTSYLDSETHSTSKPLLGRTYQYVVRAVDERGNEGPSSAPATASPKAPINIPQSGIFSTAIPGLPPESSLTISGRKKINIGYTNVFPLNVKEGNTDRLLSSASALKKGFSLEQELQVKLQGKVGKKIAVDVDYDDRTEDQRKISIIYAGDPNEVVQEAAFGDIKLDLPRTEFAGYNKELFGAKIRVGLDRFRFTAIGAQTKGITVTERFKGNSSPRAVDLSDVNFDSFKSYYLTFDSAQVNHPELPNYNSGAKTHGLVPGSVQIYVSDGRSLTDTVRVNTGSRTLAFNRFSPGIDYTVDFDRGVVNFTNPISYNFTIAVAFRYIDAADAVHSVGYTPTGAFDFTPATLIMPSPVGTVRTVSDAAHLIQDFNSTTGRSDYSLMLMNRYYLGFQNILDPQTDTDFQIKVFNTSGVEQPLPQPSDPRSSEPYYTIDPTFGLIRFRHNYPFQGSSNSGTASAAFFSDDYDPGRVDAYNPLYNPRLGPTAANNGSQFKIHIQFKNQISTFQLTHMGVIKNSEIIKKDGSRLRRDADYYIDYDSGYITFLNPQAISSSTEITVSYEYLPFGGKFQSNLFGARGEYDLVPNKFSIGSTFLYNASQSPQDIPDIRSTPSSLSLIDGDTKLSINPDDFAALARPLFGEQKIPVSVDVAAEAAYSTYAINTYRRAGENGVALVDNMEGSDDVLGLPIDNNLWFPSTPPLQHTDAAERDYVRQSVANELGRVPVDSNDKKNQLRWDYVGMTDKKWDGFVYPISSTGTNLHNYRYLEISVYSSADATHKINLNFDLGIVSEDANNNARLNFEADGVSQPQSGQDVGINNYLVGYDSANQPVYTADPVGPQGAFSGTYPQGYWGAGNNKLDSEDMDRNGQLDTANSYYEYSVTLSPGWNFFKIPLTQFTNRLGNPLPSNDVLNQQFLSYVKHARVWITGTATTPGDGFVQFETLQLTGNKWQGTVASGARDAAGNLLTEPDPAKFNATTVSLETDASYQPNTNFFIYDKNNEALELKNERSLQVSYDLNRLDVVDAASASLAAQSAYYLNRVMTTGAGSDYSNYKYVRLDLFKKTATAFGEVLFLRFGMDANNYYQYNLSLDKVPTGTWHTVTTALDGSDHNRIEHFQTGVIPNLNQVKEISLGVLNPNSTSQPEILWINNLRVADGQARMGGAYRLTSSTKLSDVLTVGTDFRDVDSDFLTIDESPSGKQHTTASSVNATMSKISFLPVNAAWSRTATYTDPKHRSNPSYSGNFATPDMVSEQVGGDIAYTQIPGMDVNVRASRLSRNTEYLEQRYNANSLDKTLTLNPTLSYTLPDHLGFLPLGSTTFSGTLVYKDAQTAYDQAGAKKLGRTDLYDRWSQSMDESYSYKGSYQPIDFISIAPSFTYNQTRSRGYLSLYRFYASLQDTTNNPRYVSDQYLISRMEQIARVDITLRMPVLSPSVSYGTSNTRDYVSDTLAIPNGSLSLRTGVAPGELFGWNQFPRFNLARNYQVQATFQHNPGASDPIEKQDFKSLWWIDLPNFEKNEPEGAKKFDLAYINSKSYTDTVNSSFGVTSDLTLSPRYEYTWKKSSNLFNYNTSKNLSLNCGLVWSRVPLLQQLINLQSLNLDYTYRRTQSFDSQEIETTRQTSNQGTATMPLRFTPDLNGTVTMSLTSLANQSGVNLTSILYQNQYSGDFNLQYNWRMSNPIRLPGFWPFNGAMLKIEQLLRFENTLHADWVRNRGENLIGQALETNTYRNQTTVNYSLWRNVQGDMTMTNEWFYSPLFDNKDYYALSFSLGLTATF